jgi:hypothetical protein
MKEKERVSSHLISALLGGVVSAVIVLLATGQMPTVVTFGETAHAQIGREIAPGLPSGKFKNLEVESLVVGDLVITKKASLLNAEEKETVVITEGSVMGENMVVAKKFVGQQIQGHAIVANRMFTTPDDIITVPMEQWRFFTELGSSVESGGELVIRSADGAAVVNKPTNTGTLLRAGFDTESKPQMIAIQNEDRRPVPISLEPSERQKQMLMERH